MTHPQTGIDIDVVLAGPGPEEGILGRAQEMTIAGLKVPVVSVEDLLVLKVLAGRGKDLDDVEGLIGVKGSVLDARVVRRRLRQLERALDRSDLVVEFDRVAHRGSTQPGGRRRPRKRQR
jgi:hypothetical protein